MLQKRGFTRPSRCPNYNLNVETALHLMDTCPLATQLWEKIYQCNRRSGKCQGDIAETIINWSKQPFQSSLLNTLWNLIPSFLYWILWKERNNRVFNNTSKPIDLLWLHLKQNLQETLAMRQWQLMDLPELPQEHLILKAWNMEFAPLVHKNSSSSTSSTSPLNWSPLLLIRSN